jgi:SAM-dependent methyltransferase
MVHPHSSHARGAEELLDVNRDYYDSLWSGARLVEPQRFNTWPLVQSLLPEGTARLEIAPGLRPRLPLEGTQFVDISEPALAKLRDRGASVALAQVNSLPFASNAFDLVCALDIVEHVDDEDGALSEISRVAKQGATLLVSVPLHPSRWTAFDDFVGHRRRYEPERLMQKLTEYRFVIRLLDLGMWWLIHQRKRALWWYNRAFMPLGLRFQKDLQFTPGMIQTDDVDEVILQCRKALPPR